MENIKTLSERITVENVTKIMADGWDTSYIVAKYIIGTDVWDCLPEDDKRILSARVHRIRREARLG